MRPRAVAAGCLALILAFLLACDRLAGRESDLSYEEASKRIVEIAEESIRLGLGDQLDEATHRSSEGFCANVFNAPSDYVHPAISYQFPIEALEPDPESFLEMIEKLWANQGLRISSSDSSSFLQTIGATDDGFNFRAAVSFESGIVDVGGTGPCVSPPSEEGE